MKIPGVALPVGQGTCKFTQADEPDKILITINGTTPVVNDLTCMCCLKWIDIGPNLRVPLEGFFSPKEQAGVSMSMDGLSLKGPMADETEAYILSGPQGAVLMKDADGFSLVSGIAFFIDQ